MIDKAVGWVERTGYISNRALRDSIGSSYKAFCQKLCFVVRNRDAFDQLFFGGSLAPKDEIPGKNPPSRCSRWSPFWSSTELGALSGWPAAN